MKIYYHPRFKASYQKLSRKIKVKAEYRESMFRKNLFNPLLKTHKLHGKLKNYWSFSINNTHRIIFEFHNPHVTFLDIGTHELYK